MTQVGPADRRRFKQIVVDLAHVRAVTFEPEAKIVFYDGQTLTIDDDSARDLLNHFSEPSN